MAPRKSIEIMAPAGTWESLTAALQGGANSVYFGIEQLNMRARATNNFTLKDLADVAEVCSAKNVRTYVTLNTVMFDHDMILMRKIADGVKANGITAVIASDHAVIQYAHQQGVEVHISTQTNVTNVESVRFWSAYADVVVLARELSLVQIKHIVDTVNKDDIRGPSGELLQIEVFAHGALCMASSGTCYLSLHSENSSANRGACKQNCRRTFIARDSETGVEFEVDNEYLMSPKDLCTIEFLDQILATGVVVLKLEGRGRAPDYVRTVTECYREAADAVLAGSYSEDKVQAWKTRLESVYNRGFWSGYFLGQMTDLFAKTTGSKATRTKLYIGRGEAYFARPKVGQFRLEANTLKKGDRVLVTGPTTGAIETTVDSLRVDDQEVDEAQCGSVITIPMTERVRPSDKIYRFVETPQE